MIEPAHVGHWLVNVLYVAPVLIVVVAIVVTAVRERRRGESDRAE